ncbi:glycosyltransferase [Lysobacter claricitrinus]|uniref:glycosyltransferase n=1 Tax=Lysobacter claricitrinus TaxID=3367728 RepID=UPI0037DB806B
MKVLLIAYEFPPSPSPQALRWAYLSRELIRLGHEVHVLTPDLGPVSSGPSTTILSPELVLHRTYAGPVRGLIAWRRKRRAIRTERERDGKTAMESTQKPRHRLAPLVINRLYKLSEHVFFPDIRCEWRPFAKARLSRLLRGEAFDVVISSHEPATTLELGLHAKKGRSIRWIADLGDPVLAPYTPRRWTSRANSLERTTCETADTVSVTAESAAELLIQRHKLRRRPVVMTQGYEATPASAPPLRGAYLEMVYTGRFYSFRRAEALFEAVAATPGVRLSVATASMPMSLARIAARCPDRFRLLGLIEHEEALVLQKNAHVLVNIANAYSTQIPGKIYEYLGAQRPILHLTHGASDAGAELVRALRRGWVVQDDRQDIQHVLQQLVALGSSYRNDVDLSLSTVEQYSWTAIGARLDKLMRDYSDS